MNLLSELEFAESQQFFTSADSSICTFEDQIYSVITIIVLAHLKDAKIITPHACTRDKVIGSVVIVNKKIAGSQHLGNLATRKDGKSIEYGEKLALLYLESSSMVYKRYK